MATKQMMYETDARTELLNGVSQLARAVKATLGPRGRNVVLQKSFGSPRITKDGVSVAKEIELPAAVREHGRQAHLGRGQQDRRRRRRWHHHCHRVGRGNPESRG